MGSFIAVLRKSKGYTQRQLADMLGVPRETTSRVCSTLTEAGLIVIKKKRIFIPDPALMAHFYKTGEIAQ